MIRTIASVALFVVLCGCAADPVPAPSTTASTSTPAPEVSGVPDANPNAPHPFVDLDCSDLVPASIVNSVTDEPISARAVAPYRELSWFDVPEGAAVRQLGGFTCEWSNGASEANDVYNPAYSGIYVSVLPNATEEWPKLAAYTGGALSAEYCTEVDPQWCQADALDGTTWLHVELRGARAADPAGARNSVVSSVRSALAAGSPTALWSPPSGTLPIDIDCEALDATIGSYFGRANNASDESGGGWSQEASSWSLAGIQSNYCSYFYETPDFSGSDVSIRYYAGAGWALDEALNSGLLGTSTQFTTPSMISDDGGWIVCNDATSCALHLKVAKGWVSTEVHLRPEDAAVPVDDMLQALAEAVTAQVRD